MFSGRTLAAGSISERRRMQYRLLSALSKNSAIIAQIKDVDKLVKIPYNCLRECAADTPAGSPPQFMTLARWSSG